MMDYTQLFIHDEEFQTKMKGELAAFRQEHYQDGTLQNAAGLSMHYTYLEHPYARGIIVISHGFCEFLHKYDEAIYYFYQLGYSVYFPDHMGHGFSYRLVSEVDKVHAVSFSDYIEDFHLFVQQVVIRRAEGKPLFLFAHSMGGAIGAGFLERYPGYFQAAVLSSPMLDMSTGKIPKWVVLLLADIAAVRGKSTDYVPTKHGFDDVYAFADSSTLSEERYAYVFDWRRKVPEFQTYGATYGWTAAAIRGTRRIRREADRIEIPVLLAQAGQDTMVMPKAQNRFIKRVQKARFLQFPESKHEIFNSIQADRERFYSEVFDFFKEYSQ